MFICGFLVLLAQPLMDNLDSQTYDIFEKDPFKYLQYEKVCEEQGWVVCTGIAAALLSVVRP